MTNVELVDRLIELVDSPLAAKSFVSQIEDDELLLAATTLKQRALFYLQRDASMALAIAEMILNVAQWRELAKVRALGLQTKAIVLTLSQREYEQALELFAASEAIYQQHNADLEIAVGQVSRIWALACLQRYDEAFTASEWTKIILNNNKDYRSLAALNNNLGAIYGRRGHDAQALEQFRQVEESYSRLGEEGLQRRPLALFNQAIVLRNMGRFQESIAANEAALELAVELNQKANIARAEQNLGITYFLLGRITEAQALLQRARDTFIADHRYRDAIMAELFVSDGLLHLRRFEEVLEICRRVKETFREAGTRFEVAQALLNEAAALSALEADDEALSALDDARQIFENEGNEAWHVYTDLEEASLQVRLQNFVKSEHLARHGAEKLHRLNLPLKESLALIIAAQAALAQENNVQAARDIEDALMLIETIDAPDLRYKALLLSGKLAQTVGDQDQALMAYDAAISELERLQGRIMVEFRADFLADKDEVYRQAVAICLQAGDPRKALVYAERAKSRALLSMLSHHVDLRIEAKSVADQELVDRILSLREKRDRLYRRWETGETQGSTVNRDELQESGEVAQQVALQNILQTEDEIRTLWHRLLISNTAYSRDASLWQVQADLNQEALDERTLLVEYFTLPDSLVVFLVSAGEVRAVPLPSNLEKIESLQQKLALNFSSLKKVPHYAAKLTISAQNTLQELYLQLVAPWIGYAEQFDRLVIIPHGPLHYLPFQALYNGHDYLLQKFQINYLPGSSFVQKSKKGKSGIRRALVMGHTQNGRLFNVPDEVHEISSALAAQYYLDDDATRSRFQMEAPECAVVHVAAHGDFNPTNPLFSGLYLGDGLLTTLDIFNMRLSASLVTLSACQTGRNLVGGGDELFGLTRAFLTAGASSLMLTLWPVEDRSTTYLMSKLYQFLLSGQPKAEALQNAQLSLMANEGDKTLLHPYFWAPFFLIGDPGPL